MKKLSPRYLLFLLLLIFIGLGSIKGIAQQADSLNSSPADTVIPATQGLLSPQITDTVAPQNPVAKDTVTPATQQPGNSRPYSYSSPQQYTLAGLRVTGAKYLDQNLLLSLTGLTVGEKIVLPGDKIASVINKLWDQKLFSDVQVLIDKIQGNNLYLDIAVTERPKLANFTFKGVTKTAADEIKKMIGVIKGRVVTQNTKITTIEKIKKYYQDKGYRGVTVQVTEHPNTNLLNAVDLIFNVNKGKKVKISEIMIAGNAHVPDNKIKKKMKDTHEKSRITLHPPNDKNIYGAKHITFKQYIKELGFLSPTKTLHAISPYFRLKFTSAKFNEQKYEQDKVKILDYYNTLGFRDAVIQSDTLYYNKQGDLDIALKINEGKKYYFGNITWRGNTKYSDSILSRILNIHKGDIYNNDLLEKRLGLQLTQEGGDISGLYQDDGYLFFHVTPVETAVHGDTIDYEIRIAEGPQATIDKVNIAGNDKTNEHVIRRELRTIPGQKFSRDELIRSQRQIAQLGFFDPEKTQMVPVPNPNNGTVDINYTVQEKPSDQLELSAGFGGYIGLTGTLGITFNNFSAKNIFKKGAWRPLPSGDGQKLSVRVQSNGKFYHSYNFSFTEPWLGGKKRNPFSISFYNSFISSAAQSYSYFGYGADARSSYLRTIGATVSLGKQLEWPDDYFSLQYALSYQQFKLKDYNGDYLFNTSGFSNGTSNNINLRITLTRNSTDQPTFPTSGSNFYVYGEFTPPYSAFEPDKNYKGMTPAEQFKFIEYQKYRFTGEWYVPLGKPRTSNDNKRFVIKAAVKFGFLGSYNSKVPLSPFERFEVGGDGMSNYAVYGKDIISQRGYETYYSSDPKNNSTSIPSDYSGFTIFNKYTLELRYPISLNPSSTIYALTFFEAANGYNGFKNYDPFRLRRSAGIGMRFFLPMFGLLGFDYGVGFDRLQPGQGLKDATKFSFMLGYEPD